LSSAHWIPLRRPYYNWAWDHDRVGTATVGGRVDLARKPPGNVLSDLQTGPDAQRAQYCVL